MPGIRISLLAGVLVGGTFWIALAVAAKRFARRREKEGAWNEHGPIHPTEPPLDFLRLPGYVARRPTIESEPEDEPRHGGS